MHNVSRKTLKISLNMNYYLTNCDFSVAFCDILHYIYKYFKASEKLSLFNNSQVRLIMFQSVSSCFICAFNIDFEEQPQRLIEYVTQCNKE